MRKRGISSTIASTLVIGITVLTVTIVALWGGKITEQLQSKQGDVTQLQLSCVNANFDILNTDSGSITLENTGQELAGVIIVAKGNGETQSVLYDQSISPGETKSYPYMNFPNIPEVDKVTVIGAVGEGIYKPCSDQRMDVNI